MVIDSNSILSRVPPPGAVPVSLSEAAHMWSNEITSRNVSLVGMVVKIKAPNQSKTEPKVKNIVPKILHATCIGLNDPIVSRLVDSTLSQEL